MKTIEQIEELIKDLQVRRDGHYQLANEADTSAGEDALICLAESDQDWIDALEWALSDS